MCVCVCVWVGGGGGGGGALDLLIVVAERRIMNIGHAFETSLSALCRRGYRRHTPRIT